MVALIDPTPDRPYSVVAAEGEASPLDVDPGRVEQLYKRDGALLLRGFTLDVDSFRRFAQQFCIGSTFNESGRRDLLDPEHNIQSVNRGADPFPLHPELSREPWRPDVCFFGCLQPPSAQGATTICDGIEIVRHLPPEVRVQLEGRHFLYWQVAGPEELRFWLATDRPTDSQLADPPATCPFGFHRKDGEILRYFTRPILYRPMFAPGPAFGNFLLFARYLRGRRDYPLFEDGSVIPDRLVETVKRTTDTLTARIQWQAGDLLMVDNSRFMHGRTAIANPEERLIASYFGYLKFAAPDAEEPANAPWRQPGFQPPLIMTPTGRAA